VSAPVPTDAAGLKELGQRLSNWGRWGANDEIGRLNFVTPEVRVAAARLVVTGKVFDLGMSFGKRGPWNLPGVPRFNPIHLMTVTPARESRKAAHHRLAMRPHRWRISHARGRRTLPGTLTILLAANAAGPVSPRPAATGRNPGHHYGPRGSTARR
jgi:hypothetical protein